MTSTAHNLMAQLVRRLPVTPPSMALSQGLNLALRLKLLPEDLSWLEGRRFQIEASDIGLQCRVQFVQGRFSTAKSTEVTIRASTADFLLMMRRKVDPDTLFFQRRLMLEGDTDLGLAIKNLLDSLDVTPIIDRWPLPASWKQRLVN